MCSVEFADVTPDWWPERNRGDVLRGAVEALQREFQVIVLMPERVAIPVHGSSAEALAEAKKQAKERAAEALARVRASRAPRLIACSSAGCPRHFTGAIDELPAGWIRVAGGDVFCSQRCLDRWRDPEGKLN